MVEVLFPPVTRRARNKNKSEMNRCLSIRLSRPTSHQPRTVLFVSHNADRWWRSAGAGPLSFTEISARLGGDQPCICLILDLRLRRSDTHSRASLAVDLRDEVEVTLMQALPAGFLDADRVDHNVRVKVALPPLIPGRYWASLWVGPHNTETYDAVESAVCFEITISTTRGRTFPHCRTHGWVVPHSWMEICTFPENP